MDSSGLSSSRLASRLGKLQTEEDESDASTPKNIGDGDVEMEGSNVEVGLRHEALSSTLRAGSLSKAETSCLPSVALTKDIASTGTETGYDFERFVATPKASSFDSAREDVDNDSED